MIEKLTFRVMWGLINGLARIRPYTICAGCMAHPHGNARGMTAWALVWRWVRNQCPVCGISARCNENAPG